MFEALPVQVFAEFLRRDQNNIHSGHDWSQEFIKPVMAKTSLMDRILPAIGEILIRMGYKLKQRSHAPLNVEQAQAPNFLIML